MATCDQLDIASLDFGTAAAGQLQLVAEKREDTVLRDTPGNVHGAHIFGGRVSRGACVFAPL
jgi:hypothetical protein